jgi:hypothetical protein
LPKPPLFFPLRLQMRQKTSLIITLIIRKVCWCILRTECRVIENEKARKYEISVIIIVSTLPLSVRNIIFELADSSDQTNLMLIAVKIPDFASSDAIWFF